MNSVWTVVTARYCITAPDPSPVGGHTVVAVPGNIAAALPS
jgi:hypothetical protein